MNKMNIAAAFLLLVLTGCKSIEAPKYNLNIPVPSEIRSGECEKPMPEIEGTKSSDLIRAALKLIDRIKECRLEKESVIKIIDNFNEKIQK